MSAPKLTLISHLLCPYVQRAAILLQEKAAAFTRINIDLANKPDWFLNVSPLGKTPVLLVDDQPIFESAVICEYLEETLTPVLHPTAPLAKARHRSWIEFGSATLNTIAAYYSAPTDAAMHKQAEALRDKFRQVNAELRDGPFFAGRTFSVVDATFAPVFRYFDVFERFDNFEFFDGAEKVSAWRQQLSHRPSVVEAVRADYSDLLTDFLLRKNSAVSRQLSASFMDAAARRAVK